MAGQQAYWLKMGLLFGYPQCCIESFLELRHLKHGIVMKLYGTGFIPCAKCNITKTEEQLIQEINKNRCKEFKPFAALDPEPEKLYIVMGKTTERVYEHSPIPLHRRAAEWWAYTLNISYARNHVDVSFYITPILDI